MSTQLTVVRAAKGLRGQPRVPGDKSISHRALIIGALASGTTTIKGLSEGDDVHRTADALQAMGVKIENDEHTRLVRVHGVEGEFTKPTQPLDMGNSGTAMRLMMGLCSGLPFETKLVGDESLSRRPMERVAVPLRLMGAQIETFEGGTPPVVILPAPNGLRRIEYDVPIPSAQVKSAVIFGGLWTSDGVRVTEKIPTRAHTEEMLLAAGADITYGFLSDKDPESNVVEVRPSALRAMSIDVAKDPSQAAFWICGACIVPGSEVTIENVYVGSGRAGFLDVLRRMGALITVISTGSNVATITASYSDQLVATTIEDPEVAGLIDEVPILSLVAAMANGKTIISGAQELRIKETDRIFTTASALRAFGVKVDEHEDGLSVSGVAQLKGATIESSYDHRIAMMAAIAGLVATGTTQINQWECVATSYPGFEKEISALTC